MTRVVEAMTKVKPSLHVILLIVIGLGLAACSEPSSQPFRAPSNSNVSSVAVSTIAAPTASAVLEIVSTPTPRCTDALEFVTDLTYPDGTIVKPGDVMDKRWQIKNSGSCNWTGAYRLKLVSGLALGGVETQSLYPARGGSEAIVRMVFIAPPEPGVYRSAWQAYNPEDQAFGDPFFIEIEVTIP